MNSRTRFARHTLAVVLLLMSMLPVALWAQGSLSTITGIVKDPSGSVIPAVGVTVRNQDTGSTVTVATQANGTYLAPQLLPGTYTVSANHPGFKRLSVSELKLDVGSTLTQDLTLEIGILTDSVTVLGQASLVETTSGAAGTTVSIDHVFETATADRNVFLLINLAPGAFQGSGGAPVLGGGSGTTLPTVDGILNSRGGMGIQTVEVPVPLDAMQEFKVQLTSYSAEYDRAATGQLTAVTKSGTNAFHGSVYEFLRNDKFDAKGWGVDRLPPLRRNNFGGTAGGPIIRSRTFFFFNLDGLRQHQGSTVTRDVGLPEWRTGNFSTATRQVGNAAVVVPIYDPETGTGTFAAPQGNTPFPGNIIPSARLDPVAVKAAAYIPNANRPANNPYNQSGNYQLNRVGLTTRTFYIGRVDHDWSDKTKMFVRYLLTQPERGDTPPLAGWGDADPDTRNSPTRHQNLSVNVTRLFSPTFFATVTGGFNRAFENRNGIGCCTGIDFAKLLGIPNALPYGFPYMNYSGGSVSVTPIGGVEAAAKRLGLPGQFHEDPWPPYL
jgi:hypothetical protein